jgi:hypothetical protein
MVALMEETGQTQFLARLQVLVVVAVDHEVERV